MNTKIKLTNTKQIAKKICVIGTWHLGCIVSSCLAEMGNIVHGIDFDKKTISNLQRGIPPLYEPNLEPLIKKNIKNGRLKFFQDFKSALKEADFIFITFDTPVNDKDKSDLKPIFNACKEIANHIDSNKPYIVVSSQIPVGTCKQLKKFISKINPNLKPDILYNPENLRLGKAIDTFMLPDRIVIGAEKKEIAKKLIFLYKQIKCPKFAMSLESAEMVKHALNSYLATSISFINEIANLCETTQANICDVVLALKSDKRIGKQAFLSPGLGFAGGTLARDLQVLLSVGKKNKIETKMIQATLDVNRKRPRHVLNKIRKFFQKLKGLNAGILGLTYKPGTSTLRRSISIELAKEMLKRGIKVKAYDPKISKWPNGISCKKNISLSTTPYGAAKGSHFLLIATEWSEFKNLDFNRIRKLMVKPNSNNKKPILIDTKNMLNPAPILKEGFEYLGTGISLK